jgi:pimeloyl-ACP methyl ester carboxylesterase
MEPFVIDVDDRVLDDLRARLARTRLPVRTPGERWSAGMDPDYLRELLAHWADGFDWRGREAWLNSFPQYLAQVNGQTVHFAYLRGARKPGGPAPLPLVVTHGWPYSFADMLPLAAVLADPAAHGGQDADTFDIVVPSLPGHGYSTLPEAGPVTGQTIAETWVSLMTDVLGHPQFGTYGEDVGGGVSDWLAAEHPDRVIGIHASRNRASGRRRGGGLRRPASVLDRGGDGGRRREGRAARRSRRADRALPEAAGRVQDAEVRRRRGVAAQESQREDSQTRSPRRLCAAGGRRSAV